MATKQTATKNHAGNRRSDDRESSNQSNFKKQLANSVLTACLTLIATLVGIGFTQHFQQNQWNREKAYTIESDLLSRRFALLDRFLKVSRRDAELSTLKLLVQNNTDEVSKALRQKDVAASYKLIKEGEDDVRHLDDGRAEYLAVLALSAATFGPKTQHAIAAILAKHNPNVWEADEDEKATMVEAMSAELGWGLPDVPISTSQSFSTAP